MYKRQQKGLWDIVGLVGNGGTALVHIPYALCYMSVALFLLLTAIRCIQNIMRLWGEKENELGARKPNLDLDACEREYLERREQ